MSSNNHDNGPATDNSPMSDNRNPRNQQRTKPKWHKNKQSKTAFTGKTREMSGQVFQLQVEQKQKGQFQETLDQLQVYASSSYKKDIKHLKVLFTKLETPTIVRPKIDDKATPGEQTIFAELAKQYIKDVKSLETTLTFVMTYRDTFVFHRG